MSERELYRKAIIKSNWIDEYSFDNYYFIKDGKYVPVSQDCKEFADWLNIGWDMWQLSANRQGYKLVPVEPTQEMINAARETHEGEPILPYSFYKAMIGAVE